jgi:hypothetical protein
VTEQFSPELDALDVPVWGAKAIARVINRSVPATYHMLTQGLLDTDKVGAIHCSTARRLLRQHLRQTDAA